MEKSLILKGSYGYLKRRTTRVILLTILMFCSAIGVLLIGVMMTGTKKNLLTIVAILGLLPAARSTTEMIMLLRAKKYTCSAALHDAICEKIPVSDQEFMRYDLYMTAYEHNFPMYALGCKAGSLVCFMGDAKQTEKDVKSHIEKLIKQNALKIGNIKIYFSETKFIERLAEMHSGENEFTEMDQKILRLMENISL